MSAVVTTLAAFFCGLGIGWAVSGAAVLRVEPIVKCDVQKLYGEVWEACRAKGSDYMLSDTIGQDDPPKLKCVGTHETTMPLKELAP